VTNILPLVIIACLPVGRFCYFNPDTIGTHLYGIQLVNFYRSIICLNDD
jgi:hypothetical protein